MTDDPKPGSNEEMRKWMDIVGQKGGVGIFFGFSGWWAKAVSILTAIAVILGGFGAFVAGLDSGRNIACKAGVLSKNWCGS